MKKFISFLLVITLCFGVFPISAFAASEKIVVEAVPSKSELLVGETFTVDFNLTTNEGFYTLGLEVSYDKDVLEVVCPNHVDGSNCTGSRSPVTNKFKIAMVTNNATDSRYHNVTPYKIMWGFGTAKEDCTYLGTIATLTFKVKKAPASGDDTTIALVVDQSSSIVNNRYSDSQRKGVSATVTVNCPGHELGEWVVTKEPTLTETGIKSATCTVCGKTVEEEIPMLDPPPAPEVAVGDVNGVDGVTDADAEYLLMYTFFPEDYPVNQTCDFNGDDKVNDADAEYLLMYTFFPEDYPLTK